MKTNIWVGRKISTILQKRTTGDAKERGIDLEKRRGLFEAKRKNEREIWRREMKLVKNTMMTMNMRLSFCIDFDPPEKPS